MHYSEAGNAVAEGGYESTFQQEIEVMNRSDGLYIRHHFKNLSNKPLEIMWPEVSINRACYIESTTTCSRLNEDLTTFIEGDDQEQSISYMIPRGEQMSQVYLFENSFAKLAESMAASTYFHLTDEIGVGGQWINGLKLVGREQMGLIDYSFYKGQGEVTDLYWHNNEAPLVFNSDKLSIYGVDNEMNSEDYELADAVFKELEMPHYTILLNSGNQPVSSSRFMIKSLAEGEKITDTILINQIHKQYRVDSEDHLTAEFIASLLSEKPIGSKRTAELYDEVVAVLSVVEMEEFAELVLTNKEDLLNWPFLDEIIKEVTGFQTSFFVKNDNVNNPLYPFLFEEPRTVYINGEESPDLRILLKDGRILYPGVQVMEELGFESSQNDRSLYLENEFLNYRFPLEELFYVLDERKYSVMSSPFERMNGDFYFDEVSLIRIFLLDIKKSAEKIEIVPISNYTGESK